MSYDYDQIRKKLKKSLDAHRFEHTLGVAYTAAVMASVFDEDIEKAKIAGYLHDCAKCMSDEKKLSICDKQDIPVSDIERQCPSLLHGKVGAYVARNKYGIEDEDILNAIANHTTGRPGMSKLEKIIFVADYVEPGRNNREGMHLEDVRRLALTDLDGAVRRILSDTLRYLHSTDRPIDETTQKTFDYYDHA
ncbi:MAG: bis(5'-nucleosyl)-tetraphosphatase (symmetrical) YqeK [Lachnospiraceae bacterium]|nr:bis(5'-nucleosyl)-tetraphosphatase (symmetrical) YqeK [Lachnospiraceae bacterium]